LSLLHTGYPSLDPQFHFAKHPEAIHVGTTRAPKETTQIKHRYEAGCCLWE